MHISLQACALALALAQSWFQADSNLLPPFLEVGSLTAVAFCPCRCAGAV